MVFIVRISVETKQNISRMLDNPKTTYADLKQALPEGLSDSEAIKTIRTINVQKVKKQVRSQPKGHHKLADTVQTKQCSWPDANGNMREIKLVGFRHGLRKINSNSVPSLQRELTHNPEEAVLLVEQNLNPLLETRNIPTGQDIGDHAAQFSDGNTASTSLETKKPLFNFMSFFAKFQKLTIPFRQNFDAYPSFDVYLQMRGFAPEHVEMSMHSVLPTQISDTLDESTYGQIGNERSAYMAGYIQEAVKFECKDVIFAAGGGHIPRIESILSLGSAESIPKSQVDLFSQGARQYRKDKLKSLNIDKPTLLTKMKLNSEV